MHSSKHLPPTNFLMSPEDNLGRPEILGYSSDFQKFSD